MQSFRGRSGANRTQGNSGIVWPRAYASTCRSTFLHDGRGRAMTTFNRIFTTERLLQIIVILAATVAMKLMG